MNRRADPLGALARLPVGLRDFVGTWRLSRRITDRMHAMSGHAEGRVCFIPEQDALRYDEQVTMHLPGQKPIPGTRSYLWREGAGSIEIAFDDGRPFHAIPLGLTSPEAVHLCDPDRYAVVYDFADWPVWGVTWEVSGPRKDYRMETLFVREKTNGNAPGAA